jgi:hypothetical protein
MMEAIAIATLVFAILAVILPLWFRYRDRIALEVDKVKLEGEHITVSVRNRGGTPGEFTVIGFVPAGHWPTYGTTLVGGHERVELTLPILLVSPEVGEPTDAFVVESRTGKRSKLTPVPSAVVEALREHRRITGR